jgi:hypothetical protein
VAPVSSDPGPGARQRRAWIAVAAIVAAIVAGCGKVGPPLPPIRSAPSRPNQLDAVQVGPVIRLSWTATRLDLRKDERSAIRRADVYRLRQSRDATPATIADEFEAEADIIGFLDYDTLTEQMKRDGRLVYEDTLDLAEAPLLTNTRFQYAVRFVDGRERPLTLSNIVSIEPVPGIARPPAALAASQQQDQIALVWTPPTENIDGSSPAQVVGYNVYRAKPSAERLGRPLNDRPLTESRFVDRNFLYLTPYVYVVRSVSQGPEALVESSDSDRLEVTPRDTFAPSAPTNVTAASAAGVVSLFWPTNTEPDVVGYFIYRREANGEWARITDKPVTRATYRDERVRVGARYGYRLTAVDRYGNESAPSGEVIETASP